MRSDPPSSLTPFERVDVCAHVPEHARPMSFSQTPPAPQADSVALLTSLVYELLDAHLDTEQLMLEPSTHLVWLAHLHYLRDLQRCARARLAREGSS
jgi:hypothetical protein